MEGADAEIVPPGTRGCVGGFFLDGLLSDERRKTGWMRVEAAGDPGPWRQQAMLDRARWNADTLCDIVRDDVFETLAAYDTVPVIDETGFLKHGKASCGVSRRYTGSAGNIANCRIEVFAACVSRHGHAVVDHARICPKHGRATRADAKAHVTVDARFVTEPTLARPMIDRAIVADVAFSWVVADSVYGVAISSGRRAALAGAMCSRSTPASLRFVGR